MNAIVSWLSKDEVLLNKLFNLETDNVSLSFWELFKVTET